MVNKNNFWLGKKVLITGHTGFKGAWLSLYLKKFGAELCGVSLPPSTTLSLFDSVNLKSQVKSEICDIRDIKSLKKIFTDFKPEIVFHLAAQPLVGLSYEDPIETYDINVMGTLYVLEAIRHTESVKSAVMITTDKCYENKEWVWGYREKDELGGHDPYSSSKAAAEILIKSYRDSYFKNKKREINIASVRAGNVIGGGDWAVDRLIPDIFKNITQNKDFELRNPNAVRPWQHVLDPLTGYMLLARKLYECQEDFTGAWNFGPDYKETKNVGEIVDYIQRKLNINILVNLRKKNIYKETTFLKLDSAKSNLRLKWKSIWDIDKTLEKTVEWYLLFNKNVNVLELTNKQIEEYIKDCFSEKD